MSSLLIRDLPATLHHRLKETAARNRRSMTQQAIALLEEALLPAGQEPWPVPFQGKAPLTPRVISRAKREGRA